MISVDKWWGYPQIFGARASLFVEEEVFVGLFGAGAALSCDLVGDGFSNGFGIRGRDDSASRDVKDFISASSPTLKVHTYHKEALESRICGFASSESYSDEIISGLPAH
jgi:hypothetical protein